VTVVWAATLLAGVLAFAVAKPARLAEAWVAVPAAALAVVTGLVPWEAASNQIRELGSTVAFLAAVLVLAHLAERRGVFAYVGALAERASRGEPRRLLVVVFGSASLVTAALSLDATVVLLTPVVYATAVRLGARPRPHLYACTHLANSASLLLPISNLTNLLAFSASGLSFGRFAAVMALPWLAVIAVEYLVNRRFFDSDLWTPVRPRVAHAVPPPWVALVVLALTLLGFPLSEPLHVHPAWIAAAGAVVLAIPDLVRAPRSVGPLLLETSPAFVLFVLALGVVVLAVRRNGLDDLAAALTPNQASFLGLLAMTALAAVLANLVNNLPATLILLPAVAHSPGLVLAVLIGVNVGPNLTYVGSLATLLWRRVLHARGVTPPAGEFLRLGALTVPPSLLVGVAALWAGLQLSGLS
jgi:arsenical pump membrane protein